MDYRQEEYREELEKVQDRDFTHSWVSSSAFIFYLSVFCILVINIQAYYGYCTFFKRSVYLNHIGTYRHGCT